MFSRRLLLVFPALGVAAGVGSIAAGVWASRPIEPTRSRDAGKVTVGEYAACVRSGACALYTSAAHPSAGLASRHEDSTGCRGGRADRTNEPINCVDWYNAVAYCKWIGKHLPTREEWLHALESSEDTFHRGEHEWTASAASAAQRGPWEELRFAAYRPQAGGPAQMRFFALNTRSPNLGFRCAG